MQRIIKKIRRDLKASSSEVFSNIWKTHIPDDLDRLLRMLDCMPIEETTKKTKNMN